MQPRLTERILNSSIDCSTKCYLLLHGRRGKKTEYELHADEFDGMYQRAAITRLKELIPAKDILHLDSLTSSALYGSPRLVIVKRVEVNGWRSDGIVLFRPEAGKKSLQPTLFHRYEEVSARAKLLLAFRAALVGDAIGVMPTVGEIIHGSNFNRAPLSLSPLMRKLQTIIDQITHFANDKSPPFFLCSHCEICEFNTKCASRAAEEDSISQLDGISRKQIEEQHRKGIFTLHQYSHTFRSRKSPKRVKKISRPRYFALQARSLRDQKIYIYGKAELPVATTSVYLDIEGIPGCALQYLFGMLIITESTEVYHSYWAADKSDQVRVFIQFCETVAALPNATLFHYGNYEIKVIKEMRRRVGAEHPELIDRILAACCNVLSVVHQHCYFPTHSNRLKDVAHFLGYRFNNPINSGLMSVIFRERWERSADEGLKKALITYNKQDCEALKTICLFVSKSATLISERNSVPGISREVIAADSLRKVGEGNRPMFGKAEFSCPEFEVVNKCAYFDYQRDHVFARTRCVPKSLSVRCVPKTKRRLSLATTVAETSKRCTTCGSRSIVCEKRLVRWLIDLKYYKTKIGVKKWQPRYVFMKYRCMKCHETFTCPNVPIVAGSRGRYGHGLMCWCVYHNIVGKQSMLSVLRGLQDIFNLNVDHTNIYRFRTTLAKYYECLRNEILATILKAKVIHIDETPVKLRKTTGYVWVVSSATEVCYIFRDTREGSFLQELLGTFEGVLVSDFFTAYDSLNCPQQKCLIHLMRDINDDLHRDPYNQEMRSIAEPFGRLLKEIVLAIDRFGLRRRHLHKYVKPAEKLCSAIAERQWTSAEGEKYKSRFDKYQDKLFTFLKYDNVPWNNNNAEHAIHYFAKLRQFTDGMFTQVSLQQLLILLSVIQTCEYQRINPLRFLLTGETQFRAMSDLDVPKKTRELSGH
jgi:predicted RecB family nuclease